MQKGQAKPPKATSKPYSRHILGIYSGVQSHPKATPKPHQSHTKATPRLHQGSHKATPKPSQGQGNGWETAVFPVFLRLRRRGSTWYSGSGPVTKSVLRPERWRPRRLKP